MMRAPTFKRAGKTQPSTLPTIVRDSRGEPTRALVPQPYEKPECLGARKRDSGQQLKKLNPRHMRIVSLHLQGVGTAQIAEIENIYPSTVSSILHDPLTQRLIAQVYQDWKSELKALGGLAVATIRDAFESERLKDRMVAIDKLVKLKEDMIPKGERERTAEDEIRDVLSNLNVQGGQVQVNQYFGSVRNDSDNPSRNDERGPDKRLHSSEE